MHVYRWDLDRTYLDTAIDSMRGLLRSAFEDAANKRALPGATALLRGIVEAQPQSQVCILSGSPLQMRAVLEEKLTLDGIRFDKLILKDNLGNLRRGRLRALRGQVGYKLPVLLLERLGVAPGVGETLFGDDSEADALIYVAYAEVLAGRLAPDALTQVLERSGAYSDHIETALRACVDLPRADVVDRVFIRLDRMTPPDRFVPLGSRVVPIYHWMQASLVLWDIGHIGPPQVARLLDEVFTNDSPQTAGGLVQDAARRGLLPRDRLEALIEDDRLAAFRDVIGRHLSWMPSAPSALARPDPPDVMGFLARLHA